MVTAETVFRYFSMKTLIALGLGGMLSAACTSATVEVGKAESQINFSEENAVAINTNQAPFSAQKRLSWTSPSNETVCDLDKSKFIPLPSYSVNEKDILSIEYQGSFPNLAIMVQPNLMDPATNELVRVMFGRASPPRSYQPALQTFFILNDFKPIDQLGQHDSQTMISENNLYKPSFMRAIGDLEENFVLSGRAYDPKTNFGKASIEIVKAENQLVLLIDAEIKASSSAPETQSKYIATFVTWGEIVLLCKL